LVALSRAPSAAFLAKSESAPAIATVCSFCSLAISKYPRENSRTASGPAGNMEK
jgi:hypothetical protein